MGGIYNLRCDNSYRAESEHSYGHGQSQVQAGTIEQSFEERKSTLKAN